ncbi:MAG: peptidase T [Thermoguttaceae bacterium]|nr:peptidase T [Thermoguttaceae bacterium]
MKTPLERFLKYATIETTSNENADVTPSTSCQFDLARLLVEELRELGLADADVDEHCYVTATIPTNQSEKAPTIGFIAHLDTSCAASGAGVKPRVIEYAGGDVVLENGVVIPSTPDLAARIGRRIVVTDGTTLLGADDKAGVAAIMAAAERILKSDEPRPNIKICFTPDEEIGNGTAFFDVAKFAADCAYTVDGGAGGEINGETFTADKAILEITGFDVHPGEAKDAMVNAARILSRIVAALPLERTPETTDGREPFIHLYALEGGVSKARATFLLRAFDEEARAENKRILQKTVEQILSVVNPSAQFDLKITQQYLNMGYFLKSSPAALDRLEVATKNVGLSPRWIPIRGGTDGSRLTEMGLPTPNVFTGGRNFHSVTEWLDVEEHEKAMELLVELSRLWSKF